MIRNRFLDFRGVVFVFIFSFSAILNAQYENKNTSDLKTEAAKSFQAGNYKKALTQYQSLLARYPKDGLFSYYCGLSLLEMNKDISKAIEYLDFSSSKATVPYQVFYYLGDAYTRNYQFPQAKKAYSQFADIATKAEEKELLSARHSEMSGNAISLTSSYNQVDILASSLFSFRDSSFIKQLRAPGGTLSLKPSELLPTQDGIKDITNLMFIPRNMEKGDFLIFAGTGKNKKRGSELYIVKTGNGKKYSEPIAIEALNTDYNEIMPYYDPIGKDLIFASMGHSSMGGFDLFKSHYDSERNSWTPPINLGFPINSPENEYLMIPGTDMGSIMLITDRQGLDSMITAYMLRIHEPKVLVTKVDPAELKKIGRFGGIEAIPDMVDMSSEDMLASAEPKTAPAPILAAANRPKKEDVRMEMPAEYRKYLKLALDQQFKADSLSRLAREARVQVKNIPEPDERWNIQKKIISWEKGSTEFQTQADEYYLKVKQMENGKTETKKVTETIEKDTVINNITVYKYKPSEPATTVVLPPAPIKSDVKPIETPMVTATATVIPVETTVIAAPSTVKSAGNSIKQFEIKGKSSYSPANPFPEDVKMPSGAYYKIQLAVLSQNPEWTAFGGITPVTFEPVTGKALKKYYAGRFTNYENAKIALEEVRRNGFPEAFIVAWFDGQKLTVGKVVELEK